MSFKLATCYACSVLILVALTGCKTKAEKDMQKALISAEQGAAIAQFRLGKMYATGEGIPQNLEYAYMWVNFADSQGLGDTAKAYKSELVKQMTAAQIKSAEKLSVACRDQSYKDC